MAKGYTQKEDIEYFETFSLLLKKNTIKTLLDLAAMYNWHLEQINVNNAFLYGDLIEDVFMKLFQGYKPTDSIFPSILVCKLQKSLYYLSLPLDSGVLIFMVL